MNIETIGTRGVVFSFDDLSTPDYECLTNIYAIVGEKNIYLCDTFLGPAYMKEVKQYLYDNYPNNPFIIFNSHYHWDHIWGNCAFPDSKIIAHELCLEKIQETGKTDLEKYKKFQKGKIKLIEPNLLFKKILLFEEEHIKIFHTPGHSIDSSSLFDLKDKILFAGDSLERPIPYIRSDMESVKQYINSLEKYTQLEINQIVPGHGPVSDSSILDDNLAYLRSFPELNEKIDLNKKGKSFYLVHLNNLQTLAKSTEESKNLEAALNYYQLLLDVGIETSLLKNESKEKIREKITQLKK